MPAGSKGLKIPNVKLMKEKMMASVVLFDDRALFLADRSAIEPLNLQEAIVAPLDNKNMLLPSVSFSEAKAAGCDLQSAANEWGISGSRKLLDEALLDPTALLDESFLRGMDLSRLQLHSKTFAVFALPEDFGKKTSAGPLRRKAWCKAHLSRRYQSRTGLCFHPTEIPQGSRRYPAHCPFARFAHSFL